MSETIGFIGLGVMGRPMAKHIAAKGHTVVVYNRSRAAMDELVAAGAIATDSPADVARRATVIITMVSDTPDRKSTRLNSSHPRLSRMPSSA